MRALVPLLNSAADVTRDEVLEQECYMLATDLLVHGGNAELQFSASTGPLSEYVSPFMNGVLSHSY